MTTIIEEATAIRPFEVDVPQGVLDDLRRPSWENKLGFFDIKGDTVPAAVSVFPRELHRAPRSWAGKAHLNLIYFNEVDRGNHLATWQEPGLFHDRGACRVQVAALAKGADVSETAPIVVRGADVVRSMAERAGATITELEGSHVIMVSQPEAVTNVIVEAVGAVAQVSVGA